MNSSNQEPVNAAPQLEHSLFVTCGQALEPLLIEELNELGYHHLKAGYRGVHVERVTYDDIYRINYASRIAGRVLLPLLHFNCYDSKSLYRSASTIDWSKFLTPDNTLAIDANVNHQKLTNSLFAAQIVKDAICDQLREKTNRRPSVDSKNPDVQLNLFIHHTSAVLSFDTSGAPLHKRGYRLEAVEAPIQESLAAALLRLAKYNGEEILLDPCCGSGTFLIEAALIASKTAPGFFRKDWGFMRHHAFSRKAWLQIKNSIDEQSIPLTPNRIFGCDINKNAVRICKSNLRAMGLHQFIEVFSSDFRDFIPPILPNFIITNPPHGKRLDDVDTLKPLYRSLGEFLKTQTEKPARGFVFVGSLELAKEVGLAAKKRHVIANAGVDSRFLEYDIVDRKDLER